MLAILTGYLGATVPGYEPEFTYLWAGFCDILIILGAIEIFSK